MKALVRLFVGLWLPSRAKNRLLTALGDSIHPTARIAPIVLLGGGQLLVQANGSIGALTSFRSVRVRVGESAEVGQLNWISAAPFLVAESSEPLAGCFVVGARASFTNRHYVDASGGVDIGAYATVAGVRSVLMTHGIDIADATLITRGITIGVYSMVGSSSALVPGSSVPAYSVVAMGSTVIAGLNQEYALYAGAPAVMKKSLDQNARYFTRKVGAIPPRQRQILAR